MKNFDPNFPYFHPIYKIACKGEGGEKDNARRILKKHGYYLDKADILWEKEKLEKFTEQQFNFFFGFNPLTK